MSTMSTSIGEDVGRLLALDIHLKQKMQKGEITPAQLEWFLTIKPEERERVMYLRPLLVALPAVDDHLTLLTSFEFTVPKAYVHETQLELFTQKARQAFDDWDDNITDKNFARVSHRLIPGKRYGVDIFGINKQVESGDCLKFLTSRGDVFVGPQGLSLIWTLAKDKFPKGKFLHAYDLEDARWEDPARNRRMAFIHRHPNGKHWKFGLGHGNGHLENSCLLSVRELN